MRRNEYQNLFQSYLDVVTLPELCAMLGGIADGTARKLMRENRVEHFIVNTTYFIPKIKAIDYICGQHYRFYRRKLKHRIK